MGKGLEGRFKPKKGVRICQFPLGNSSSRSTTRLLLSAIKSEAPSTAGMEPQGIVEDAIARRRVCEGSRQTP